MQISTGNLTAEDRVKYGPRLKGAVPGPKARAIVEADHRVVSPSYTRSYPMVAKRGWGIRLEDVDGNEFLDFAAGIAVNSTGHCHPEVVAAIQKQAAELIHASGTDFYYEHMIQIADRLSAVAPMPGPHRYYFGNSGAEAIEAALKIARYHTGRQNMIAFFGAFHGRTMGALSLTGSKVQQRRRFGPLVPGVTHIPFPYAYRNCTGGEKEQEQYALDCARYLENKIFKTIVPPEEVAAIFIEPIQGEGGYLVAPDSFLQELRRIADKYGILLVSDEVQAGAGRTGKWWSIEHSGVQPDIVCMAKGIASGMPLGICMTRAELMDWKPGSHASTFGGNPVAIAAALATMDILEREAMANAGTLGEAMIAHLRGFVAKHAIVGEVRGRGLMIGVEIVQDQGTREAAPALRDRIVDLAFERGLLILGCGESSFRLSPPLILNQQEATIALEILDECIGVAEREHSRSGELAGAAR
ncbi:MAG TPA: acetyl ornithine aminotransferase family protein [Acidobacteriaceae bacterium]|jgi:4-aminobutyrate aminotransferase|nr:acetyl ornithine aminotransferase family protein [Acidobacteriaceae bacterium]